MLALFAIAVLAPLLYIPGYLIERAVSGRTTLADLLERHFVRTALGAVVCGWLALTLAELGVFHLWLFLPILLACCVVAGVVARRRGGLPMPQMGIATPPLALPRMRFAAAETRWLLAYVALGVLVVVLVGRPFEVVLGGRDAGFYANAGFAIANHGSIWQHDTIVAQIGADQASSDPQLAAAAAQAETNFLGIQNRTRFLLTGLRTAGFFFDREQISQGEVISQGFHLFPAWIGLLTSLLGMQGGLLAPGLMGLLGVWGVGMLGRRIGGPWVGWLAALLLALNGVQVWFSRYSTTETTAQFLTFAGMWSFAVMHSTREQDEQPSLAPALLAGLALGQWALVRIEFVLVAAPVLLYLLYTWLTRRWQRAHTVLGLGFGAMLVQAALHITFFARGYFFDTLFARLQDKSALVATLTLPFLNDSLREVYRTTPRSLINPATASPLRLVLEIVALLLLVVALVLLRRWQRPLVWFERAVTRWRGWLLGGAAALVVVLCAYAYLVRPQILTGETLAAAPGCLAPAQLRQPDGACLALQGYIGAPIAPPSHPDPLAYTLGSLAKLPRQPKLPSLAETAPTTAMPVRDLPTLEGRPSPGLLLDTVPAGETVAIAGRSVDNGSLLVRDQRGVTGWVDRTALPMDDSQFSQLPEQADRVLARVVNPLWATSLSPGNPSEATKFAIYQASMVRFGWYLSPLGVLLAVAGLALLCWRLNAASWLLVVVGGMATYTFIEQAYGTDDATYIYLLRRFVPQGYPLFCIAAAVALVALARLGWRMQQRSARPWPGMALRLGSLALALGLAGFLGATNFKLYRHTEYAGAIGQIGQLASQFGENDVVLLRGGAPTWGAFRDLPDIVATPLTYAFDRNALTIKSQQPGNYAAELARYIERWQAQGRTVYLVLGPSGGLSLPGLQLDDVGTFQLSLREYEQLTNQKPTNSYSQTIDYHIYRFAPGQTAALPTTVTPSSYASQERGFYRPELLDGETYAWTNGDALLRLPWPSSPTSIRIELAGGKRPASLGATQVCASYRAEQGFFADAPKAGPYSEPTCIELNQAGGTLTLSIDPASQPAPATGTMLLRLESDTWIPARDDTGSNDARLLGVLFKQLTLEPR